MTGKEKSKPDNPGGANPPTSPPGQPHPEQPIYPGSRPGKPDDPGGGQPRQKHPMVEPDED